MRASVRVAMMAMVVAGVGAQTGCALMRQAVRPPVFAYRSVNVRSITFEGAAADALFEVRNPNPFGITLKGYEYTLTVGDRIVFTGEHETAYDIPARGTKVLIFPLDVRFDELAGAVASLEDAEKIPYILEGTATVAAGPLGDITLAFAHRDTLPRPIPPIVSLERLRVREFSLAQLALEVTVRIENPGAVGYSLDALRGAIELDGEEVCAIALREAANLPPDEVTHLTFPVHLSIAQLGEGLTSLFRRGQVGYRLTGDALARSDRFGVLRWRIRREGDVMIVR